MTRTVFIIIILLSSSIFANAQTELWQKQLLQKVNTLRQKGCKCGRKTFPPAPKLTWESRLEQSATSHAVDMYKNKYFEHNSLNGDSYADRIDATGYNWKFSGENIAEGQKDVNEVFKDWFTSRTHCENMMNKDFRNMGAAQVKTYWVQDFGTLLPNKK